MDIDARELCKRVVKYVLQGLVVAFAAIVLPKRKPEYEEALTLAIVAAAVFAILDILAPNSGLGEAVRQGAGLGLGFQLVKFPWANSEGVMIPKKKLFTLTYWLFFVFAVEEPAHHVATVSGFLSTYVMGNQPTLVTFFSYTKNVTKTMPSIYMLTYHTLHTGYVTKSPMGTVHTEL